MQRFAFIDVANTKETAKKVFGFDIDWEKLAKFLRNEKWQCRAIFYYEGMADTNKFRNLHKRLQGMGYTVKSKLTFFQKNRENPVTFLCGKCSRENTFDNGTFKCQGCSEERIVQLNKKGFHPKANFDVEITIDALSYAKEDTTIILFTGDGDFRYLAEKLVEQGAAVVFISTSHETIEGRRKRFSTRLKDLIAAEEARAAQLGTKPRVRFLEIDNLRKLIEKEENAAERDVSE